jgi:hypothetical protein
LNIKNLLKRWCPIGWNNAPLGKKPALIMLHVQTFPRKIADAVLAQQVILGMTTEQVQFSWGEPRNRSQSVSAAGTFETWSYPNHDTTVSFVNGKVESWMTTR